MFVNMTNDASNKGVEIYKVAGDDYHTGINRIRQGNINIEKESDKNHVRKNVTKKLYALAKQHKHLAQKVILAVTKNFNYMLQQNAGKPEDIDKGLKAVVEHMFGNHTHCQSWCGFVKNPENYKHGNLPYGKDLSDESLHIALSKLFNSLDSHKLAFLSSTQANESFNNTMASKAPKARHYSDSSSLQYRLCASVSQKNEGYAYITGVHKAAGLSPSLCAKKRGLQLDRKTEQKRQTWQSIAFKRRHLILKAQRNSKDSAAETREGDTYVSNIGQEKDNPDITEIPSIVDVSLPVNGDVSYLTFDLETGGLSRESDILQISAIYSNLECNKYITPTQPISMGAPDITKLTAINGHLYFEGNPVDTVTTKETLLQFIKFLNKVDKPVLVSHNIEVFDLSFLHVNLVKFDLWDEFVSTVVGFVDTLLVFRKEFPKRSSYKVL